MNADLILREELLSLLRGGEAHMNFQSAVAGFPMAEINRGVPNGNYTIWHLLEHMRIAQWDILEFVRNPKHVSPEFPKGYWPDPDAVATSGMWKKTVSAIKADLKNVQQIVRNRHTNLLAPIPHAKEYTLLREVLLVADHNAFHVSELVSLRRVLDIKPVSEY